MIIRVEIRPRAGHDDGRGRALLQQAGTLGIPVGVDGLTHIEVRDLFFLDGTKLTQKALAQWVPALLQDTVVEDASWETIQSGTATAAKASAEADHVIEVTPLPGVTDSVAETLLSAAGELGFARLKRAATGRRYLLTGRITPAHLSRLASGLLANKVVEAFAIDARLPAPFVETPKNDAVIETVAMANLDAAQLLALSQERRLALDGVEMAAVQAHFIAQQRDPTDLELEMLAQTWSEHCVHKTFQARIELTERDADGVPLHDAPEVVESMYRQYIKGATFALDKPWLRSVFVDNAGIIAFDDKFDLAFKVETHNHPSALEPFGGANTGTGGVIRDVLGVSARPIACTDVLCFGPPDLPVDALPEGVLHPRRIADGVIAGIEDYGNKMGIPTVNGAIVYDPGYTANPLVYCGCLGVLPTGSHKTSPQVGDRVVCIGGRTGRDGLRGATFSSMEMSVETSEIASTSVQIGHPIHEKQVMEVMVLARDAELYTAVTDCGAGGLSSAIGEMASKLGATVHLERVPLKYPGLGPWEVWLSEAQERMVLAVPDEKWDAFEALCTEHGVEATDLGRFTGDGRLVVRHGDTVVGDLDAHFLHEGMPQLQLTADWRPPATQPVTFPSPPDLTADLLRILAMPDVRSNEDVVRQFDHEVQGGTVCKPMVGPAGAGPGDAAVLVPLDVLEAADPAAPLKMGVALSVGLNPQAGKLDPEIMAWLAVDEAVRNAVAVGGDPDYLAILDNFCWGNPRLPDRLGGLVLCARGCHDAAIAFGAPFISGKDSLNNEYVGADGDKHAIPGTLLISAIARVPDVAHTASMDLKRPGDRLYLVGVSGPQLGASVYLRTKGLLGDVLPTPVRAPMPTLRAVHQAIASGLVQTCHDCSEGGVAVAVAEMAFAGGHGADVDLRALPGATEAIRNDALAFAEAPGRFVLAVSPKNAAALELLLAEVPFAQVGAVRADDRVLMLGHGGATVLSTRLHDIDTAFRGHLRAGLERRRHEG